MIVCNERMSRVSNNILMGEREKRNKQGNRTPRNRIWGEVLNR